MNKYASTIMIVTNLMRANMEWIIPKILGNPNGSVNIMRMKPFSIASQTAAVIPRSAVKYPRCRAVVPSSKLRASISESEKKRRP